MIAPEGYGEIVGGSQREEDIKKIKENLKKQGEDICKYNFYLDTRRYGSVPHGAMVWELKELFLDLRFGYNKRCNCFSQNNDETGTLILITTE